MNRITPLLFLLLLAVAPSSDLFAQKGKDKIVMPIYHGGEAELHKYIISELKYPLEARINNESGEVVVAFSVGMNGYISGVRVVRSVSESLDAEAVRVVSKMRPWIPGKKNGRPVRAEMTIPIKFKVNHKNKFIGDEDNSNNFERTNFRY